MNKTDYIKAFTEAIEKADLENEIVVHNLENALVMASARYENGSVVNVESKLKHAAYFAEPQYPSWDFAAIDYRLKPEPQYKPFDAESFKPYRDCWFRLNNANLMVKAANYFDDGISFTMYQRGTVRYPWEDFMNNFTLDGKPAGVEIL